MKQPWHVVSADRSNAGLFIYFADGKCGFYPDLLLYRLVEQATPIVDHGFLSETVE